MASSSKKINNTNCSVYGCHSRKDRDRDIHFHYYPKPNSGIQVKIKNAFGFEETIDVRKAWEKVLLMGKPVTKNHRVCSKHFTSDDYLAHGATIKRPKLKKYAVPSQNLPQKKFTRKPPSSDLRTARLLKRQNVDNTLPETAECEVFPEESNYPEAIGEKRREFEDLTEDEKVAVQNLLSINSGDPRFLDKEVQVSSGDILVTFVSTIKNDSNLNSLTGIKSFELLEALVKLVTKFFPDKKQHKLSVKERIILVFMKLKMSLKLNILSFLFKISASLCKTIFVDYVYHLSDILKSCIHWPSFEECQKNMPNCFSTFKNVRVVLDCLEIPIEKPKCLCCRVRTYSHYKGRETLKIMTGVSPAGLITFLSKCYGGRASDKAIFVQSNLIRKLQSRQDSVMVDKGFLIDDVCRQNFINLIRPNFLRSKKQFTESESKENLLISRARVHVERVNQRIRTFNILNTPLPYRFVHLADHIMVIICGIVNLQTPILAIDKF